jgi:branched-chain amino acid transport system permease protein
MLVVGGIGSLAGAVVGTVAVSMITEILSRLAQGVSLGGLKVTAPQGLTEVGVALAMLLVLIYRPLGLMAGRELRLGGEVPHNGSEHGRGFTSWWVGARTKETEGSTSDSEQ